MSRIISTASSGASTFLRWDEDWADRLASRYSVAICLLFAGLTTGAMLSADKIACFRPAEFSHQWEKYMLEYCWVKNTYIVSSYEGIPGHASRQEREIAYYQWTPLIMILHALLFMVPGVLWSVLSSGAGYDIHGIAKNCRHVGRGDLQGRKDCARSVAGNLHRLFRYRNEKLEDKKGAAKKVWSTVVGTRRGANLYTLCCYSKAFRFVSLVCQFLLLNYMVAGWQMDYGPAALKELLVTGSNTAAFQVRESSLFPRVTYCDFQIRRQGGNPHWYTVQCTLPWNLFFEKMYIFLWFWLIVLMVITLVSLGLLIRSGLAINNLWFITNNIPFIPSHHRDAIEHERRGHLNTTKYKHRGDPIVFENVLAEFTLDYLKTDGVFILQVIARNMDKVIAADVVIALWDIYTTFPACPEIEIDGSPMVWRSWDAAWAGTGELESVRSQP